MRHSLRWEPGSEHSQSVPDYPKLERYGQEAPLASPSTLYVPQAHASQQDLGEKVAPRTGNRLCKSTVRRGPGSELCTVNWKRPGPGSPPDSTSTSGPSPVLCISGHRDHSALSFTWLLSMLSAS